MSAWGRTGRVTVEEPTHPLPWVCVDGVQVGWLYCPDPQSPRWGSRTPECAIDNAFDSLDAAVLWVLRRVDPALWRQERGAWLVRKARGAEWVEDGWYTGSRYPAYPGWAIVDPDGKCRASAVSLPSAANAARRYIAEVVSR